MYEGRIEENFCGAWSYCGYPAITIFAAKIYHSTGQDRRWNFVNADEVWIFSLYCGSRSPQKTFRAAH